MQQLKFHNEHGVDWERLVDWLLLPQCLHLTRYYNHNVAHLDIKVCFARLHTCSSVKALQGIFRVALFSGSLLL